MPPQRPPPRRRLLALLPLLVLALAQRARLAAAQPPPVTVGPDAVVSVPISLPPAANATVIFATSPNTTLIIELHQPDAPPHSGPVAAILSAAPARDPAPVRTEGDSCTQRTPCAPTPFDARAFYTRADTAVITVDPAPTVHVVVHNWRVPDLPRATMRAMLYARAFPVTEPPSPIPQCGGVARRDICRGRGGCGRGDRVCDCSSGWEGRSCGTAVRSTPRIVEKPQFDGNVNAMRDSAVVEVPADGVALVWRVPGDSSRVEFRARVLRGRVLVDGDTLDIGRGGGVFGMAAKRGGQNLGQGLSEGTPLATAYDTDALGRVVVQSGTQEVEVVAVTDAGTGSWVVGLFVYGGDAVVSIRARRCGADGLLDCPFGDDDSGFPIGAAVGVAVVAAVVIVVVVVVIVCWRRRSARQERASASGAWTDVDVGKTDVDSPRRPKRPVDAAKPAAAPTSFHVNR